MVDLPSSTPPPSPATAPPPHLFALLEWKREWFCDENIQYDWRPAICVRVFGADYGHAEMREKAELFVFPDTCAVGEVVTVKFSEGDTGNQTGTWRWPLAPGASGPFLSPDAAPISDPEGS